MQEVEVKILEIDVEAIQRKLADLGAKKIFGGELVWTAFDFPDRRLTEAETLVRLRKEGEQTKLTLKRLTNLNQTKTSEEFETTVSDYEQTSQILRGLGMQEKRGYPLSKHRISYILGDVHFEIDTFEEFPTYLEIEGQSVDVVMEYANKLDFKESDIKPWGVREVFAYYRNKHS